MVKIIENNLKFRDNLLKPRKRTDYLVLHHSGKNYEKPHTIEQIHRDHLNRDNKTWAGFGYHYFVAKSGSITRGRPISSQGSHAEEVNSISTSIVAEGNFDKQSVTQNQKQSIIDLIRAIRDKYPLADVVRHGDFRLTNHKSTSCPGNNYPFDEIKKEALWKKGLCAADNSEVWLPKIKDKKVALLVNNTSLVNGKIWLTDFLINNGCNLKVIFAPEHGIFGETPYNQSINSGFYKKIPLISLFGKKQKPSSLDLKEVDIVIFDIQDAGARFYTYISTMHYMMEACAENNVKMLILDRPNPNDHYIGGPVLKTTPSFIGMHPIPIVHGLTLAELALMINGEGWLKNRRKCNIEIIPCNNYYHGMRYFLPVPPSPALPNMHAVYLYPVLCLLEATELSVGRGTKAAFQIIGAPKYKSKSKFNFIVDENSDKYRNETCYGIDFRNTPLNIKEYPFHVLEQIYDFDNNIQFDKEKIRKLWGRDDFVSLKKNKFKSLNDIQSAELDAFKKYLKKKYLIYKEK